jgi:hypothetical protein
VVELPEECKVRRLIVGSVPVDMVNVTTFGDWTIKVLPNSSMQPLAFALIVEAAKIIIRAVKSLNRFANNFNFHEGRE